MKYLVENLPEKRCNDIVIKHPGDCGSDYNLKDIGVLKANNTMLPEQQVKLKTEPDINGFSFKQDKKSKLIEDIKAHVLKVIGSDDLSNLNFSYCLSEELGYHYTYLTNIFSQVEGTSIKKYIIHQKIERVKKLLLSEGLNLKQISSLMKYKSVSHLTNQFKKMTGMTPSNFKKVMM